MVTRSNGTTGVETLFSQLISSLHYRLPASLVKYSLELSAQTFGGRDSGCCSEVFFPDIDWTSPGREDDPASPFVSQGQLRSFGGSLWCPYLVSVLPPNLSGEGCAGSCLDP